MNEGALPSIPECVCGDDGESRESVKLLSEYLIGSNPIIRKAGCMTLMNCSEITFMAFEDNAK